MLYCNACESEVERLSLIKTVDLDTGISRYQQVCGKCLSLDIVEARACLRCGGINKRRSSFICKRCKEELKRKLEDFLKKYTVEEQEAMLEDI